MPDLTCPVTSCAWVYHCEFSNDQCMELIKLHVSTCHIATPSTEATSRCPKVSRPIVDIGIDQEKWNAFVIRWKQFRLASGIPTSAESLQLFHCASEELGTLILRLEPDVTELPVDDVLRLMQSFAVIRVSKGAQRAELMKMTQGKDESIRSFVARVQGKARTCDFKAQGKCKCDEAVIVDYTREVVKDVLIAGLADHEVQTSVLEVEGIDDKPLNEIISIIERKERARKAYRISDVATISGYKLNESLVNRPSVKVSNNTSNAKPPQPSSKKIPCPTCKKTFLQYNGRNTKPFKNCFYCFSGSRKPSRSKPKSLAAVNKDEDISSDCISQSASLLGYETINIGLIGTRPPEDHPKVIIGVKVLNRSVNIVALADTGAQSNVWALQDFESAGFNRSQLRSARVRVSAANRTPLNIIGKTDAYFEGKSPDGSMISTRDEIYVSDSVRGFYLSRSTQRGLGIISENFPTIGEHLVNANPVIPSGVAEPVLSVRSMNFGCLQDGNIDSCKCPQRSAVPPRPSTLPFAAVPENNQRMKEWLLNRYAASTFNTCPHRPLQQMDGPPVEIHLDKSAIPRVCNTPAQIPLHWQDKVRDDLIRDEALGIIEKVPFGVPVTWCHRMVVTRKHDGTPRRTVDLSPLNKFCRRETFSSESPFHLARRVPKGTWKSVTDAWNGYHSVPFASFRPSPNDIYNPIWAV